MLTSGAQNTTVRRAARLIRKALTIVGGPRRVDRNGGRWCEYCCGPLPVRPGPRGRTRLFCSVRCRLLARGLRARPVVRCQRCRAWFDARRRGPRKYCAPCGRSIRNGESPGRACQRCGIAIPARRFYCRPCLERERRAKSLVRRHRCIRCGAAATKAGRRCLRCHESTRLHRPRVPCLHCGATVVQRDPRNLFCTREHWTAFVRAGRRGIDAASGARGTR